MHTIARSLSALALATLFLSACGPDEPGPDGCDPENACGGCNTLPAAPGDACQNCGTWACDGAEALVCLPAVNVPGTDCTGENGCTGAYQCGQDGRVFCSAPIKNACDVCGGPVLEGLDAACTGPSGCEGITVCNGTGTGVVCDAPGRNDCDVCGGPLVEGVGEACTSTDGCEGVNACNPAGDAVVCETPALNACGVCGPEVTGLGDACTSGTCTGELVCDAAGTGTVCSAPDMNNCGVCGVADVAGVGEACVNADGCSALGRCDAAGTGLECPAPAANACDVCGGPAITGLGEVCHDARGCAGQRVCNAAGTGTLCEVTAACTSTTHLVISEVSGGSNVPADDDPDTNEFVELYNPSGVTYDLAGVSLWYKSATGSFSRIMVTFPAGTTLPPHRYLLLGKQPGPNSPGYVGPPAADLTYNVVNMSGSPSGGGQVWLAFGIIEPTAVSDAHVIDMVGWGDAVTFEGSGVANDHPPVPGSVERKASTASTGWDGAVGGGGGTMGPGGAEAGAGNGYDSNDNAADFVQREVRDPQNSVALPEP